MLIGLIARGIAFEFRAKANVDEKWLWNRIFFAGSFVTALSQGYMLGAYVLGLEQGLLAIGFGILVAFCLVATYAAIGAAWLIYKTEGELQKRSVRWMRISLVFTALGMGMISIVTPLASERIFAKWFSLPEMMRIYQIVTIDFLLCRSQA